MQSGIDDEEKEGYDFEDNIDSGNEGEYTGEIIYPNELYSHSRPPSPTEPEYKKGYDDIPSEIWDEAIKFTNKERREREKREKKEKREKREREASREIQFEKKEQNLIDRSDVVGESDVLVITSARQYPWGMLHNDYAIYIRDESNTNYIWPSVSHAVYASILSSGIQKTQIMNTLDTEYMKQFAAKCYTDYLLELQGSAIHTAYRYIFDTNEKFRQELAAAGIIKYEGDTMAKSLVANMLMSIKNYYYPDNKNTNIQVIDDNSIFGMHYEHNITMEGYRFRDVIQYVYYVYYLYFTKDISASHNYLSTVKDINDFELIYTDLQNKFLNTNIRRAFSSAIKSKLMDQNISMLLKDIPPFRIEDTFPFVNMYITPISTEIIMNIKGNMREVPSFGLIIDMRQEMMKFKDWIFKTRLPNILYTIRIVFNYLHAAITPDLLKLMLELFHSPCGVYTPNTLVYHYPLVFFDKIQNLAENMKSNMWERIASISNGGDQNIYLIWIYISMLSYRLAQVKSDRTYNATIKDFQDQTPSTLKNIEVYKAIRNILYFLKQMSIRVLARFDIGDNELKVVQKLFRIHPYIQIDTDWDDKIKIRYHTLEVNDDLLMMIGNDIKNIFMLKNGELVSRQIYYLVEHISHSSYKYTQSVRSHIHFYS